MKYILMLFSPFLFFLFRLTNKGSEVQLSSPEPREDDVISLDDGEDTEPFIRLPFYDREGETTGNFERASIAP